MTGATKSPGGATRGRYHPFRAVAVELYERPLTPTTPVIMPYWRWSFVALALGFVALAGLVWWT